ncbi:hypothetical protein LLG39_12585 [bacterium]|nr:hypothetical protein [bacterium]
MLRGLDQVQRNLDKWYSDGILKRAAEVMAEIAAMLEGYAKSHHDYQDQTANTTNSTRGFIAEATPKVITTVLTAGMAYDVFLELARNGKWAWIWPAVEENLDEIKAKLQSITQ